MLKDITIGQHYPANSEIHRLDARTKIIATFIFYGFLFSNKSSFGHTL